MPTPWSLVKTPKAVMDVSRLSQARRFEVFFLLTSWFWRLFSTDWEIRNSFAELGIWNYKHDHSYVLQNHSPETVFRFLSLRHTLLNNLNFFPNRTIATFFIFLGEGWVGYFNCYLWVGARIIFVCGGKANYITLASTHLINFASLRRMRDLNYRQKLFMSSSRVSHA